MGSDFCSAPGAWTRGSFVFMSGIMDIVEIVEKRIERRVVVVLNGSECESTSDCSRACIFFGKVAEFKRSKLV